MAPAFDVLATPVFANNAIGFGSNCPVVSDTLLVIDETLLLFPIAECAWSLPYNTTARSLSATLVLNVKPVVVPVATTTTVRIALYVANNITAPNLFVPTSFALDFVIPAGAPPLVTSLYFQDQVSGFESFSTGQRLLLLASVVPTNGTLSILGTGVQVSAGLGTQPNGPFF